MLKQISVFVENKAGRLASIMEILNEKGIDVRAMTIADTADFGIIRLIVNDTDKALQAIKADGCTATVTNVIGFSIADKSGGLYDVIKSFCENGINIEYSYSLMGKTAGRADIVIRVEDNDKAVKVLEKTGISLISESDIM